MAWTLVGLSVTWWVVQFALVWRTRRALRAVGELPTLERTSWPVVSVIVPARNEGREVREAVATRLREGYPALEVALVDDRSTDDTGAIAKELADQDPRVVVARIDSLPEGWLGKVHALQRGLEMSRGEWVLFSDADVHLQPGTLSRIVAWAEHEKLDHVTVLPSVRAGEVALSLSLTAFFRLILAFARLWAVEQPKSSAAVGIGAFNLVRRSALARTAGLEWLKMEVADDMALGVMLKRSGAAQRVLLGRETVSLQFYESYRAMVKALEKNGGQAPAVLIWAMLTVLISLELGWMLGTWPVVVTMWAIAAFTGWGLAERLGHPRWPTLLPGMGVLPLAWALARSAGLAWMRGGVRWRDTFYSTAQVRAGKRLG